MSAFYSVLTIHFAEILQISRQNLIFSEFYAQRAFIRLAGKLLPCQTNARQTPLKRLYLLPHPICHAVQRRLIHFVLTAKVSDDECLFVPLALHPFQLLVHFQILHVTRVDVIIRQRPAHAFRRLDKFVLCHTLAMLSITSTRCCPSLMSCTDTTGRGAIAMPFATAAASISSPICCCGFVAMIGMPPPN